MMDNEGCGAADIKENWGLKEKFNGIEYIERTYSFTDLFSTHLYSLIKYCSYLIVVSDGILVIASHNDLPILSNYSTFIYAKTSQ